MTGWGENLIRNKSSLVLWGTVTLIALTKYAYEARCSRRQLEEASSGADNAEAQSRNNAAEERLLNQLDGVAGPFKPVKAKLEETVVGDIEEVENSSQDSDENDILAFSNACAICLEEFEEGDRITRSVATKECPHIFHLSCMKEVIAATTKKGTYTVPCPCCRQTFVETGSTESEESPV